MMLLALPQQEVGLPIEFLHLELGYRGRLTRHCFDTYCWWLSPIKQQRNVELKTRHWKRKCRRSTTSK